MGAFKRPFELLSGDTKTYLDLRLDELKLQITKGLSLTIGQIMTMVLLFVCLSLIIFALAMGAIFFVGELLGSNALGALIVAGILAIATLVIFSLRKNMFVDGFVKLFSGILREDDGKINNMKELDFIQNRLKADIPRQERLLSEDLEGAKDMFRPKNLFSQLSLGLVRGTKKLLKK